MVERADVSGWLGLGSAISAVCLILPEVLRLKRRMTALYK
jgi:hypothetical protein